MFVRHQFSIALLLGIALMAGPFALQADAKADSIPVRGHLGVSVPHELRLSFDGPIGDRLKATLDHWWLIVPDANPGLTEEFRMRERDPDLPRVSWGGAYVGNYLIGAIQARRMVKSQQLDNVIRRVIDELVAAQDTDGYLGIFRKDQRFQRADLWNHHHVLMALMMYYQETGYKPAMKAAKRAADLICRVYLDDKKPIYDPSDTAEYGTYWMNHAIIHSFALLYRETGNDRYLRMTRLIEKDWEQSEDLLRSGVAGVDFHLTPYPRWETLPQLQGLVELYGITGDERYKTAFCNHWQSIVRYERHNTGGCTTVEGAIGTPYWTGGFETCATVAWTALTADMLHLTGDPSCADELELSTFNAVLAMQHPTSRWWTYDTPSDGTRMAICSMWAAAHTHRGLSEMMCCTASGSRGLGLLSEWALLEDAAGPVLNYYGPCTMRLRLRTGVGLIIRQKTGYPSDGRVKIWIGLGKPARFNLRLRIPEWSHATTVKVANRSVQGVKPGTYLSLNRLWKPGDTIELNLDMTPHHRVGEQGVTGTASIYRGPILLAFDEHYNACDVGEIEKLDMNSLRLKPSKKPDGPLSPIVLFDATTANNGKTVLLCDFATAGAFGSKYRSWLPVANGRPHPFDLRYPADGAKVAAGPVRFDWVAFPSFGQSDPVTYELVVAETPDFSRPVLHEKGLHQGEYIYSDGLKPGDYCWKVVAHTDAGSCDNRDGASRFTVDSSLPNTIDPEWDILAEWPDWVIAASALDGTAEPRRGRLVQSAGLTGAVDRQGRPGGAVGFTGEAFIACYDIPRFPGLCYTFQAWVYTDEVTDQRERFIFSASAAPDDDPLSICIRGKEVIARTRSRCWHMEAKADVETGQWTHIAVVKEAYNMTVYVNGVPKGTGTDPMSTYVHSLSHRFALGGRPTGDEDSFFHGRIDDFALYARALGADEVKRLATPGPGVP